MPKWIWLGKPVNMDQEQEDPNKLFKVAESMKKQAEKLVYIANSVSSVEARLGYLDMGKEIAHVEITYEGGKNISAFFTGASEYGPEYLAKAKKVYDTFIHDLIELEKMKLEILYQRFERARNGE